MNKKLAKKFVDHWLFKSKDRKTTDMDWSEEHIMDAVNMIVDVTMMQKLLFIRLIGDNTADLKAKIKDL